MKTIVVYYSLEGNTKYVAETISAIIGAELLELEPVKPYPTGKFTKFISGKDALSHARPELKPYEFDPEAYDRIVIGTPVWAGAPAPPVNTFLSENDLSGKNTCFYATSGGGNADKCISSMKEMAGAADDAPTLSVVEPKKRESEKTLQTIQHWGVEIIGNFKSDEKWDLYDENRELTGETMMRGTSVPEGCYHIVVSIWLRNHEGKYLMSRRSENKNWSPGVWETTGGAVQSGETSLDAAVREVREELGLELDKDKGKLIRSVRSEPLQDFYDAWIFDVETELSDLTVQTEEVSEVKWMDSDEIDALWQENKLHLLLNYYKDVFSYK